MNKDIKTDNELELDEEFEQEATVSDEPLTDEELSLLKQSVDAQGIDRSQLPPHDTSSKAEAIRFAKKNVIFVSAIALSAVCAIVIAILAIVFAVRNAKSAPNTDDFVISIGEETYIEKYDFAMRENVLYIDMRKVAVEGGLIISGTKSTVSFSTPEGQYLGFENGSETAVINGDKVELGGIAEVTPEICMIPYKFLSSVLKRESNGLRVSLNSVDNTIEVKRRYEKVDGEQKPIKILFSSDLFTVITDPVDPDTLYQYAIDVTEYLPSIKSENLLLVNKDPKNYLGKDYLPDDLTKLTCNTREPLRNWEFQLREDAANALYAMMLEMEHEGFTDIKVTSAYRPYSYQVTLFNNYVAEYKRDGMSQEEAEAEAAKTSARPGASEHQSGLCVDFITDEYPSLVEAFENSEEFEWLSANAYKFGFIIRYPKDKEDLTGYSYEPWHYRFVGREAATEIYEQGICLEEYVESTPATIK